MTHTIETLRALRDGWDGEDAPAPSSTAIDIAETICVEARRMSLDPDELDADVLGGVALHFLGRREHAGDRCWIACFNDGQVTCVFTIDNVATSEPYSKSVWRRISTIRADDPINAMSAEEPRATAEEPSLDAEDLARINDTSLEDDFLLATIRGEDWAWPETDGEPGS